MQQNNMDIMNAVREFLFEELSKKYDCQIGSDHQDISYINFKYAIRINSFYPVHVKILEGNSRHTIVARIYAVTKGATQSYTNPEWEHVVDLPAPNFGSLAEDVFKSVESAMLRPMSHASLHYND